MPPRRRYAQSEQLRSVSRVPDISIDPRPDGSSRLRAYRAVPRGQGPWPGVVVIHELFGLTDVIRRHADRLAAAGYLALAPDLFTEGGPWRCIVSTMRSLSSGHGRPFADIEAARRALLADGECSGKVGVVGFCMGGGFALLSAGAGRGFDASAVNYGELPREPRQALRGGCPVVASYGGRDLSLRGAAGKLDAVLTDLGVDHDVKEYPGAGHSFLNDEYFGPALLHPLQRVVGLGPDPVAAADAWRRIEAFFARHLRGADSTG